MIHERVDAAAPIAGMAVPPDAAVRFQGHVHDAERPDGSRRLAKLPPIRALTLRVTPIGVGVAAEPLKSSGVLADAAGAPLRPVAAGAGGASAVPRPSRGRLWYLARAPRYESARFAVRPGAFSKDVLLRPAKQLVLSVQTRRGRPLAGAHVRLAPLALRPAPGRWATSDGRGTVVFDLTEGPGRAWATVRSESMSGAALLDVKEDRLSAVVTVAAAVTCEVIVQDRRGRPLGEVAVSLMATLGGGGTTWRRPLRG